MTQLRTDLTGNKYGRWTVLRLGPTLHKPHHRIRYWCRCDCGTERLVHAGNLTNGMSSSCGCKGKEHLARVHKKITLDLTNQRFGMLLAVCRVSRSPNKWLCLCDCGNTRIATTHDLHSRRPGMVNCGCTRRTPKLTNSDVEAIRSLRRLNYPLLQIAKKFNVTEGHVSRIVRGLARV